MLKIRAADAFAKTLQYKITSQWGSFQERVM